MDYIGFAVPFVCYTHCTCLLYSLYLFCVLYPQYLECIIVYALPCVPVGGLLAAIVGSSILNVVVCGHAHHSLCGELTAYTHFTVIIRPAGSPLQS